MILSTIKISFAVAFFLLLFAGCAKFEKTVRYVTLSKDLNESGLEELYSPGESFGYFWASGETGEITFEKTGKASIQYGKTSDSGTWSIRDEKLCTQWQRLGNGNEQCYTVYKRKKGRKYKLFNIDGSFHATAVPR